ncbi:MAG: hypothetical protein JXA14_25155 [Anaerolineae bacterium]|nr:hypothetical protein [Anaerolineae bacterium]
MAKRKRQKKAIWTLRLGSIEQALNLYSVLLAFQQSDGGGLINHEALEYVAKWTVEIADQVPGIDELANDRQGPFRKKDYSPLTASLHLDEKERPLMLFVCKVIHAQLLTPEGKRNWIENQGQEDYEMAVRGYRRWIGSLEREP